MQENPEQLPWKTGIVREAHCSEGAGIKSRLAVHKIGNLVDPSGTWPDLLHKIPNSRHLPVYSASCLKTEVEPLKIGVGFKSFQTDRICSGPVPDSGMMGASVPQDVDLGKPVYQRGSVAEF